MAKTLKESMQAMRDICKANSKCNTCPLNNDEENICFAGIAPAFWDDTMIGRVVKVVEEVEDG